METAYYWDRTNEKHREVGCAWLVRLPDAENQVSDNDVAGYYESLRMLTLLQAYLLTFTVGAILGIKKRAVLRQKWFLKAMACSLPVHMAAIAGIFYWDKANLEVAFKGFYTVGVVWLAGVIEMVVIVVIVQFWERRRTRIDSE